MGTPPSLTPAAAPRRGLALAAAGGAVVIWAAIPIAVKAWGVGLELAAYLVVRYGLGTLLLAAPTARLGRRVVRGQAGPGRGLALIAGLAFAHVVTQVLCLRLVAAGWFVLAFATSPLLILGLLGRLRRRDAAALALGLAGVALFIDGAAPVAGASASVVGLALLAGAVVTWCLLSVAVQRSAGVMSATEVTALIGASVAVAGLALAAWPRVGGDLTTIAALSPAAWAQLVVMAVMSPLGFWLYAVAMRADVRVTAAVTNLEAVAGVALAWVVFDERVARWQWVGAALVVLSVGAMMRRGSDPS